MLAAATRATQLDPATAAGQTIPLDPAVSLLATASHDKVEAGQTVVYTYQVRNEGAVPLNNVAVSDSQCAPILFVDGDDNDNGELDLLETWTYRCENVVQADETHVTGVSAQSTLDGSTASANGDPLFVDVRPSVLLRSSVTPGERPQPGGDFTYTLTLQNTSPEAVEVVELADTYDILFSDDCLALRGEMLAVGQTRSCRFTVQFGRPGVYRSTARVTVRDDEQNRTSDEAMAEVFVTAAEGAISAQKTPAQGEAVQGTQVEFAVDVKNLSNVVSVELAALADSRYGNLDGQGDCALPQTLAPLATYSCRFSGRIDENPGETHVNRVTVSGVDENGNVVSDDATASVLVLAPPAPRLLVTKIDSTPGSDVAAGDATESARASAGEAISYTVRVQNAGDAPAVNVLLTDVVDPNATLTAGSVRSTQGAVQRGNGEGDAGVEVALGNLAPGAEAVVRFVVRVDEALPDEVTRIANQATLTGDNFPAVQSDDPDTTAVNDATQTPLAQVALLEAFKTSALDDRDGDGLVGAGDRLRYTIVIENQGGAAATGVYLLDTPDRNTALIAGSVSTDAGTVVRGNAAGDVEVEVDLGTLASGDSAVVAFDVLVNPQLHKITRQIANQGTVRADELADTLTDDPTTANLDDPTVEQLLLDPLLSASKRDLLFADADANGFASPGDVLLYELQVRNDGNVTATGVAVEDVLGEGVTLVPGTVQSSGGELDISDGRIEAALGALAPNATATLSFRVAIQRPQARRNRLLGLWAAQRLGKEGDAAADYAKEVVRADFEEAGDEDVYRKVAGDLGDKASEREIRDKMAELMVEAKGQVAAEN